MKIVFVLALAAALTSINTYAAVSQKDARKLVQTMAGMSLPKSAVHVQSVRTNADGSLEISAEVEAVFRTKQVDGHWRLREIRTGQDTWEDLDLIAQALHVKLPADSCDAPSEFVRDASASALTVKRARCLVAELFGVTLPSDQVRIRDISSFDLPLASESSALIEALVQVDVRFTQGEAGWRLSAFKSGNREWANVETFQASLNEMKRVTATTELAAIANALVDFRRKRGFFVVSDKESVLIDYLHPQYLARVIRLDPWHRPYQYDGQENRFSLRSLGPDGKPNTPDDIVVSGPKP